MSPHLFRSSLICLSSILCISVNSYFTFLLKYIVKYFILFDTTVSKIVFWILFSDHSLLVYKNTTDFILILYPVTFLNSLFYKRLQVYQYFLHARSCRLQIKTIFVLPFTSVSLYFSCRIELARTTSKMLTRSDENRYPQLGSNPRGKHSVKCNITYRLLVDVFLSG